MILRVEGPAASSAERSEGSAAYAKASGYASGYDPTRRRAKGVGVWKRYGLFFLRKDETFENRLPLLAGFKANSKIPDFEREAGKNSAMIHAVFQVQLSFITS